MGGLFSDDQAQVITQIRLAYRLGELQSVYPLAGCSPAEPTSVSTDNTNVIKNVELYKTLGKMLDSQHSRPLFSTIVVFFFLPKNRAYDAQSRGFEAGDMLTLIIRHSSCPDDKVNIQILHHIIL